ncbi:MAG: DUF4870 domain-containing protein [Trueperaceae bacterium]
MMEPSRSESEVTTATSKDDRNLAILVHLAPLAGYLVAIGQILLPLAIYIFGSERPFVKQQAKESLNAQISYTIYWLVVIPLCFFLIGIPLAVALGILVLWTMIAAAIAASEGKAYRYPFVFRFVK